MSKLSTKVTALAIALILFVSMSPFKGLGFKANAAQITAQQVGADLDYDALRSLAYIVNPQWTSFVPGQSLSYVFRGQTYTETYNAARHFSSFSTAYAYFESLYTDTSGNLLSGISTANPVFILAPGTYSESRLTVRYNATILGANAGISPNATINMDTANPTSGWAASTTRGTETVVNNGFSRTTRVSGSATNTKYELAAVNDNTDSFSLVIDGMSFSGTVDYLTLADTTGSVSRQMNVYIQNSLITTTSTSIYYVNSGTSTYNINNIDFKNIRCDNTKTKGFVDAYAAHTCLDGVYFANSSGNISNNTYTNADFSFTMQNSYMYKCSSGYNLTFKYTTAEHKSVIKLYNNIFYEHNSGSYGSIVFYSTASSSDSSYDLYINKNTFLADNSYNTAANYTFLNGNTDYQKGAFAMYVNYNRVIGYTSLFPNLPDNVTYIKADFDYNYFAPSYTGYSDVLGTTSAYYTSTPYADPIDIANLIYYDNYARTIYDGMLDISGVSFYGNADYVSIDNVNSLITAMYTCGITISNPTLYFKDSATTGAFYSNSGCTTLITSITPPAANATKTVYAKVTKGSASKVVTVKLYNNVTTVSAFSSVYTDPDGVIAKTAYLLAPAVSSMSNGATYTASWRGTNYTFTVGTNVFSSIDKIFTACGSNVPQIILPYGTYGALTLTKACTIYGENYASPAVTGIGETDWGYGIAWNSGKSSKIPGITVTCPAITISGVELTGVFSDLTRTASGKITLKNSLINAPDSVVSGYRQFNIQCPIVSSASNEYLLEGVYIKTISMDTGGARVLFGGVLPSKVTINSCYSSGGVTRLTDVKWSNTLYTSGCSLSVTNSRFDNLDPTHPLLNDVRDGVSTDGYNLSYIISDNVFTSESESSGNIIHLGIQGYNTYEIENNIFINSVSSNASVLECDYNDTAYTGTGISFTGNRVVGFSPNIGAVNKTAGGTVINASNNYFASYTEQFATATSGICPKGNAVCTQYYSDYAMTTLKQPAQLGFTTKNGLTYNSTSSLLELNIGNAASTVNFTDGYYNNPEGNVVSATNAADGSAVNLSAIALQSPLVTLNLKVQVQGNSYVFKTYTLVIYCENLTSTFEDCVLLDSAVSGLATGTTYTKTWDGVSHNFIVGTDVFATQAEIKVAGKNVGNIILLCSGSLDSNGDLGIAIPGTFYSPAYAILPYVKGTAVNGSDWTDSSTFVSKALAVRNVWITNDMTGGQIVVSGVKMSGTYVDVYRTLAQKQSNTSITLSNTLINYTSKSDPSSSVAANGEGTGTYTFRMGNTVVKDAANNDTFILKNSYLKQAASGNRLIGEWVPKTTTFDGFYIKAPRSIGLTGTAYVKTAASGTIFTIKNSNLQDFYPTLTSGQQLFSFEGFDKADRGTKQNSIVFDKNILHNFAMRTGGGPQLYLLRWYGNSYSDFTFTNNYVVTDVSGTTASPAMFHTEGITSTNYNQGGNITITGNVFNNFSANYSIDGGGYYATKVWNISNNFTSTTYQANLNGVWGVGVSATGHGVAAGSQPYYLDYTKTVLNTDLRISSFSAGTSALTDPAFDNTAKTLSFKLESGSFAGANLQFNSTGVNTSLFTDAECTAGVSDITFDIAYTGFNTYYLKAEKNGYYTVYTVTAEFVSDAAPFSTLNDGTLTGSNSVILDPGCENYAIGKNYAAQWNGGIYICTVGTNVFASQAAILAAGKNTTYYTLINSFSGNLTITVPGKYYAPAYNICPYTKGSAADGSNWSDNTAFTAKSITVGNITIAAAVSGGLVEIAGFTFTGNFIDTARAVNATKTTVKLTNTLKNGTTASGYLFQVNNANAASSANIDELYVKNLYIKLGSSWRLIGENVPATVTFDGLYCDARASSHITNNTSWIKAWSTSNIFTFKNCNFRNWFRTDGGKMIAWQSFNSAARGSNTSKVVYDNNIMYNFVNAIDSQGNPFLHYWESRSISGFEFKNNYVYTDTTLTTVSTVILAIKYNFFYSNNVSGTVRSDGAIVITGNTFNGFNPYITVDSAGSAYSDEDMTIDHNYTVITHTDNLATAGVVGKQITINASNGTFTSGSGGFWLDYSRTKYSTAIQAMTVNGTTVTSGGSVNVYTGTSSTFDLTSVIVNTYGNKYTGYTDSACTTAISNLASVSVPTAGTTVYLKVLSPDGTSSAYIFTVYLIRGSQYSIGIEAASAVTANAESETVVAYSATPNVVAASEEQTSKIGWRGLVTAEGTYAAEFDMDNSWNDETRRVGIIYMSKDDPTMLDSIKTQLTNGANDLDNTVASINASIVSPTKYAQVYALDASKHIYWNDAKQAFTYLYNFTITPNKTRYAVMYVVYKDSDGNSQVSFSEVLSQTASVK